MRTDHSKKKGSKKKSIGQGKAILWNSHTNTHSHTHTNESENMYCIQQLECCLLKKDITF